MENNLLLAVGVVIVLALGAYLGILWQKHKPSARAVVFKEASSLVKRMQAMQSTAPAEAAAAAGTAASEAVALQQFKDAVAELR